MSDVGRLEHKFAAYSIAVYDEITFAYQNWDSITDCARIRAVVAATDWLEVRTAGKATERIPFLTHWWTQPLNARWAIHFQLTKIAIVADVFLPLESRLDDVRAWPGELSTTQKVMANNLRVECRAFERRLLDHRHRMPFATQQRIRAWLGFTSVEYERSAASENSLKSVSPQTKSAPESTADALHWHFQLLASLSQSELAGAKRCCPSRAARKLICARYRRRRNFPAAHLVHQDLSASGSPRRPRPRSLDGFVFHSTGRPAGSDCRYYGGIRGQSKGALQLIPNVTSLAHMNPSKLHRHLALKPPHDLMLSKPAGSFSCSHIDG